MNNNDNISTLYDLDWDTEFFGIKSAKLILHKSLTPNEWNSLENKLKDYEFVSIFNLNSDPVNAQIIGKKTGAFLADVNIQFEKKVSEADGKLDAIEVHNSLIRNDRILDIANFPNSKFTEDPELAKRGGSQVYKQWIVNSFEKKNKYFAISKDEKFNINGFSLFSFSQDACTIELIAASNATKSGIGSKIFRAVEYTANKHGFNSIKVGTQVRNIKAMNFYNKVGCKQVECHQVYHLWNL